MCLAFKRLSGVIDPSQIFIRGIEIFYIVKMFTTMNLSIYFSYSFSQFCTGVVPLLWQGEGKGNTIYSYLIRIFFTGQDRTVHSMIQQIVELSLASKPFVCCMTLQCWFTSLKIVGICLCPSREFQSGSGLDFGWSTPTP